MNALIKYFVDKSLFGNLLTIFVFAFGIYSAIEIKREAFPNVTYDIITVATVFSGASPEETEKLITTPLEREFKELDGIKKMTSVSVENRSSIVMQLDPDQITAEEAKADVQDIVDRFADLPEGADKPLVLALDTKMLPIIEIAVTGATTEEELRQAAKILEKEIEGLKEVARVEFNGLRDYEIKVQLDPKKMQSLHVSLEELITALKKQNISIPGGSITSASGAEEMIIRTVGDFKSIKDVEQTVIRANALSEPILVGQVAHLEMGFEPIKLRYQVRGEHAIGLTVLKKENADAITLVEKVRALVDKNKTKFSGEIKLTPINDVSYFIKRRLSVLSGNLIIGLFLVLGLLSFILPWRVAVLTALGIPFSFFGCIAIFHYFGVSLNLISVMGLIIVSGMLVDDAIVVNDNAQRYLDMGLSPKEAAAKGAQEVWLPVAASVLTTVASFAPLLFMSGIFGKFLGNIPLGVIIALAVSLFEAYFILPTHFASFIKGRSIHKESRLLKYTTNIWDNFLVIKYLSLLDWLIKRRYLVIFISVAFFFGSLLFAKYQMKFILFPPGGIEAFVINVQAPIGTPIEKMTGLIKPVEEVIENLPNNELDSFTAKIGLQQMDKADPMVRRGGEYAQIIVYLTPETGRARTSMEIADDVRKKIGLPQGLSKINFTQIGGGPPVGNPVSVGIRGGDYATIMAAALEIKNRLSSVSGVTDIRDSYYLGKREIILDVNKAEAAAAGLSVSEIGQNVRASYEGLVATTIKDLEEEIDVRVSLLGVDVEGEQSLEKLRIPNRSGNLVPVKKMANPVMSQGIASYEHEGFERQVRVMSEINTDITTAVEANKEVKKWLPEIAKKYPGLSFHFGGEDFDTQESMISLGRAFIVAVVGIAFLLILTFKNMLQPMLVLTTIPMGIVAAVWTLYLHGRPLSFLALIGVISLAGVIVNNAIVLIDFVNVARANGMDRFASIRSAAQMRIRPIFLTTATTVAGLLPTAYGIGGLDPFVVPIALTLGWGLAFGSVLTTIVLPAALSVLDDVSEFFGKVFLR